MTENENTGGVYIFPDADEFLECMAALQEAYNKKEGEDDELL